MRFVDYGQVVLKRIFMEFEKIDEFIWYLKVKFPEVLRRILSVEEFNFLVKLKNKEQLYEDDNFCNDLLDCISGYLTNESIHLEEHDIEHEGGDELVYEGGIWCTELRTNHDWYFWIEPEGQIYGLYDSLEKALGESLLL